MNAAAGRCVLTVLLVAAATTSLVEGEPPRLPGLALGSSVLLHAERVLALVMVAVAVVTVGARAAQGRLPVELSTTGLRYESSPDDELTTAVAKLQREFGGFDHRIARLENALDTLNRRP